MTEINKIAEETKIQNAKLEPICVGKGEAVIGGKNEATYFVVLESKDILAFRQRIFKEFVKKGGARSRFDPENFYPHVTIGFSLRDLHESDGVRKGKNACVGQLTPK